MRKLLATALLCFALYAHADSNDYIGAESVEESHWTYACDYMDVFYGTSCADLDPPRILWSEMRNIFGQPNPRLYGLYYHGSPYITVNIELHGKPKANTTIVHETVHYIVWHSGLRLDKCDNEEAAFRAAALFDGEKYDPAWRGWYGC